MVRGPRGLSGWSRVAHAGPSARGLASGSRGDSEQLPACSPQGPPGPGPGRYVLWMLRAGWVGSSGRSGPCAPSSQAARPAGLTHFQRAGLPQRTAWGARVGETWKPNLAFSWPGKKLTLPASSHGGRSWRAGGKAAGRLLAPARAGERGSCSRRFTAPGGGGGGADTGCFPHQSQFRYTRFPPRRGRICFPGWGVSAQWHPLTGLVGGVSPGPVLPALRGCEYLSRPSASWAERALLGLRV